MGLFVGLADQTDEHVQPVQNGIRKELCKPDFALGTQTEPVSGESFGSYSNLQKLRGFAAHLELTGSKPSVKDAEVYSKLREIYDEKAETKRFSHLINHSDAEGYYLPIDFAEPVELMVEETQYSCGSCQQLLKELNEIGPVLFGEEYEQLKGPEVLWEIDDFDPFNTEKFVWTRLRWLLRNALKQNLALAFG